MQYLKKYLLMPLVLLGALNWGFIGLFQYDLFAAIFMQNEEVLRFTDSAIGLAAVAYILILMIGSDKKKGR